MYYVLIGDIKRSKTINNRIQFQKNLKLMFESINQKYEKDIVKNLTITLGDEFQGVFNRFDNILEIIEKISFFVWPVSIRFGIGYGDLLFDNSLSKSDPFNSDGEAFWFAREAIDEIKANENVNKIDIKSNVLIKGNNNLNDMVTNEMLNLIEVIKVNWSKVQSETILFIIENYGLTNDFVQSEVSKELDIMPNTLNARLKRSYFNNYVNGVVIINEIMRKMKK